MILSALLFCFIVLLCIVSFCGGFYLGLNGKPKEKPRPEPEPLTAEQERQLLKRQKEMDNFFSYDGTRQE